MVDRRAARGAAIGENRRDHLRILHCPLIGLHGRHRPAEHERDPPDTEPLGEQAMLAGDIVVERDMRESWTVLWRVGVARRRGIAVPEQVDRNDEMKGWIDGAPGPNRGSFRICVPV